MGKWRVTDENGMTVTVDSETEPSDEQLDSEFERQRAQFMQGSKAAMGVNPEAVKSNLKTAGITATVAAPLMAGGSAIGAGGLARGAAGYLGGQVLESMGAPPWLGEVLGLAGGGAGAVKTIAKKAIAKEVQSELKKRAVKEAVEAATPKVLSKTARRATQAAKALSADEQRMVLELQKQMGTEEGRGAIRQFLSTQTPQVQEQIKDLLARGISQPATTASGFARSARTGPSIPPEYTSELAKLLGQ